MGPAYSHHPNSHLVLVVDDDPDIREGVSEILEAEGFDIRRACNGKEALEKLAPEPPDLILLDLMMPVMDGREFARQIRQRPGAADIPIIAIGPDRDLAKVASDIGAVGHLACPFETQALLDMVRRSLEPRSESTAPPSR